MPWCAKGVLTGGEFLIRCKSILSLLLDGWNKIKWHHYEFFIRWCFEEGFYWKWQCKGSYLITGLWIVDWIVDWITGLDYWTGSMDWIVDWITELDCWTGLWTELLNWIVDWITELDCRLDYWTGLLDWITWMDYWTGLLDWIDGLDWWTGLMAWIDGLDWCLNLICFYHLTSSQPEEWTNHVWINMLALYPGSW